MKFKKALGLTVAATAIATSASFAPVASAELSASAGVASAYLWRGFDLGLGDAAVFGDITYSVSGFHAGVWGSSGDIVGGNEYDLIIGYGIESGDFSADISWVSYTYQNGAFETDINDFVEIILSIGFGPVSFAYHDNIESDPNSYALGEEYSYFNIGFALNDQWSFAVGRHDADEDVTGEGSPTHLDVTYAYNDNLSFTVSKLVNDEDSAFASALGDDDAHFVVSYSLPIE